MTLRRVVPVLAAIVLSAATSHAQGAVPIDVPYQVHYAANLQHGDTYIDIINTGLNGVPLHGPGIGGFGNPSGTGNLCLNTYVLSTDEQLEACCSCLLTPDQVAHLGVNSDLLANPLTEAGVTLLTATSEAFCTGAFAAGSSAPNGAASIPPTAVFCPRFDPSVATLASIDLIFANDFGGGDTLNPQVNSWTFHWTGIPSAFNIAGNAYADLVSGLGTPLTYSPSLSASYIAGTDSSAATFAPFEGSGTFLAATVSASWNSGGLLPIGQIGAQAFIRYHYFVLIPSINSATVKLVATLAGAGGVPSNCTNSAGMLPSSTIVGGYVATATTLHPAPTPGAYAATETSFLPSQFLTDGPPNASDELHSLSGRCANILGNGGGFGICHSCTAGALGASKR